MNQKATGYASIEAQPNSADEVSENLGARRGLACPAGNPALRDYEKDGTSVTDMLIQICGRLDFGIK